MKVGPQADRFGEFVVSKFRDGALDFFDAVASGRMKSPRAKSLGAALKAMTDEQLAVVRRSVLAALDTGLHGFLFAIGEANDFEQGIEVLVDGVNIPDQSDGLAGELFGNDGWLAKYSKHGPESDPA